MASQSIIYQEIIQNEFKVHCGSISYLIITLNDYVTGYSNEGTKFSCYDELLTKHRKS